jgi:hypothetical protein
MARATVMRGYGMRTRYVAARDTSWVERLDLSSVEMRAVRLAGAVYRLRTSGKLEDVDRKVIHDVSSDLSSEARILRGVEAPTVTDETVLAFAGAALHSLGQEATRPDEDAALKLEDIAGRLGALLNDQRPTDAELEWIEQLFTRTSQSVASYLGEVGERVQETPSDLLVGP